MEIWKDIKDYEGHYQISNFGRIKSIDRIIIYADHRIYKYKSKILKCELTKGYLTVKLYLATNKRAYRLNRLVAQAFIVNPKNKPEVNHRDGNKLNNHITNLEWMTFDENMAHSAKNGLSASGERNGRSKLNEFQINVIRKCSGLTNAELADIFTVSKSNISFIKTRKTWNNLN